MHKDLVKNYIIKGLVLVILGILSANPAIHKDIGFILFSLGIYIICGVLAIQLVDSIKKEYNFKIIKIKRKSK